MKGVKRGPSTLLKGKTNHNLNYQVRWFQSTVTWAFRSCNTLENEKASNNDGETIVLESVIMLHKIQSDALPLLLYITRCMTLWSLGNRKIHRRTHRGGEWGWKLRREKNWRLNDVECSVILHTRPYGNWQQTRTEPGGKKRLLTALERKIG